MSKKNRKVNLEKLRRDVAHLRCKLEDCCGGGSFNIDDLTEQELIELRNRLENIEQAIIQSNANQTPDPLSGTTEFLPGTWPIRVSGDSGEETLITIESRLDPLREVNTILSGGYTYEIVADQDFSTSGQVYILTWSFNGIVSSIKYFGGNLPTIPAGYPIGTIARNNSLDISPIEVSVRSGLLLSLIITPSLNVTYNNTSGQDIYFQASAGPEITGVLGSDVEVSRLKDSAFLPDPDTNFTFYADLRDAPLATSYQVSIVDLDNPIALPALILNAGQEYNNTVFPSAITPSSTNIQINITQL